MKRLYYAIASLALLFAGCQDDESFRMVEEVSSFNQITVTPDMLADTRAHLDNDIHLMSLDISNNNQIDKFNTLVGSQKNSINYGILNLYVNADQLPWASNLYESTFLSYEHNESIEVYLKE